MKIIYNFLLMHGHSLLTISLIFTTEELIIASVKC